MDPPHPTRWPLALLTLAFLARGLFLALALPFGEPLDEPYHLAYAAFLAAEGRPPGSAEPSVSREISRASGLLPGAAGGQRGWQRFFALPASERAAARARAFPVGGEGRHAFVVPNYQSQQPPLFYLPAAALLRLTPSAPLDRQLLLLRILAVATAAAALPLAYLFFRRVADRATALAFCVAWVAFPGPGPFTGRFTNDALALPLIAAVLASLASLARGRAPRVLPLAVLLALAGWCKLYALALLPAVPVSALLAPRRRRRKALAGALAAAALAAVLISPWLLRQRLDSGSFLGLTEVRAAAAAGVGAGDLLAATPMALAAPRLLMFGRSFVWPGTASMLGATLLSLPAVAAGMSLLLLAPWAGRTPPSPARRRAWGAGAVAVAGLLAAQLWHAVTFAAAERRTPGVSSGAGSEGWYLLVALPAILALAAGHRKVAPRLALLAAACFVLAEPLLTFGALPATYAGWVAPLAAAGEPSLFAYGVLLRAPDAALGVYSRVGLAAWPTPALAAVAAAWLLSLAAAWVLAWRAAGRPAPRPPIAP